MNLHLKTQSGGIFVTDAGRIVIEEKLGTSRYAEREYLEEIVRLPFVAEAKKTYVQLAADYMGTGESL